MAALTPGPENAKKQENGAGDLANTTHGLNTIPGPGLSRVTVAAGNSQGAAWPGG